MTSECSFSKGGMRAGQEPAGDMIGAVMVFDDISERQGIREGVREQNVIAETAGRHFDFALAAKNF
jgi:2-keto-4-pentenoate hydratase/2-oxohepta-3-ene-1,7-dioic acid hydratase in catechol pathway